MTSNEQSLKSIDLLVGVRTEQSLRDAIREHAEAHPDESSLELCPVGAKDWIAGERVGSSVRFRELAAIEKRVMTRLVALQSHQRIRLENLKIHAVRAQVPVFRDTSDEPVVTNAPSSQMPATGDTLICPVCHAEVHRYNIQCDPSGAMVGCYLCRGDARRRR